MLLERVVKQVQYVNPGPMQLLFINISKRSPEAAVARSQGQ